MGVGLGLLISGKLDRSARKAAGWALLAFGAWTTVPLVISLLNKERRPELSEKQAA
jgi:hypothetical protein